jgi:integrase
VVASANVMAAQQILGHASAAVTLDVYAALFADDLDAVADQLERASRN